jgi:hypothetical protein
MDTQKLIATLEAAPGIIIGLIREVPPRTSSTALRQISGLLTSMPATSLAGTRRSSHVWS